MRLQWWVLVLPVQGLSDTLNKEDQQERLKSIV